MYKYSCLINYKKKKFVNNINLLNAIYFVNVIFMSTYFICMIKPWVPKIPTLIIILKIKFIKKLENQWLIRKIESSQHFYTIQALQVPTNKKIEKCIFQ